jgi:hypothetical protein
MEHRLLTILLVLISVWSVAQRSPADSAYKAHVNAPTAKDSAFGAKAKKIVPQKIYDFLFHDIYNSTATTQVSEIEENPFKKYQDKVIRKIIIQRLDVFGYSVYDTLRKPNNWLDRTGNKLHTNTREYIIRNNFLFFKEYDYLDSEILKDNERYLRQQGIFHDARMVVVPLPQAPNMVDVYVVVQDVWSLLPDGSVSALDNFAVGIEQRNFMGLGHSFKNLIRYNGKDPRQRFEYRSRYLIPSFGRSFVSGLSEFAIERDIKQLNFKIFRPFLTPKTKIAGSLDVGNFQERKGEFISKKTDSLAYFWANYMLIDAWAGYAFPLFFGDNKLRERARFVVSARYIYKDFNKLDPTLTANNSNYQNVKALLFGVGFSNRRYVRDLLIYGFGRTEDVPVGGSVAVVVGHDNARNSRPYASLKLSMARYMGRHYFYGLMNIGGYADSSKIRQGIFNFETSYISPLLAIKHANVRLLSSLRFTTGINRLANDYFNISGQGGIQGVYSDALRGSRKLVINLEAVWFSNVNVLGFRMAPFAFADVGWVSFSETKFFNNLYSGYGLGFRFRNENLTFNTFQIRLGYYPNIPSLSSNIRFGFDGVTPLRFRDFDISAPDIQDFR